MSGVGEDVAEEGDDARVAQEMVWLRARAKWGGRDNGAGRLIRHLRGREKPNKRAVAAYSDEIRVKRGKSGG